MGAISGATAMPLNTTFSTAANTAQTISMERCTCRTAPSAGAGMQRPPRAAVITRLAVSATFVRSLLSTRLPWWEFSVRRHGLFLSGAGQAGQLKSRLAAVSHACGLNNDVKAKIHFEENSDTAGFPQAHVRRGWARPALVEATIIAPILVVMSIYVMDFGLLFYNKMEMQNAAQAGAQWAIANRRL